MNYNDPKNCLTFKAQCIARSLGRQMEYALKPVGLTNQQFTTLTILSTEEFITVTELADMMGVERTTMTRNIEQMRKKNWLELVSSKDQRVRAYKITNVGQGVRAMALPLWQEQQNKIVARLGSEVAEGLAILTDRI